MRISHAACMHTARPFRSHTAGGYSVTSALDTADDCLRQLEGPCCREVAERLPWAEEVLVSRGDLEDRRQRVAELEAQAWFPS